MSIRFYTPRSLEDSGTTVASPHATIDSCSENGDARYKRADKPHPIKHEMINSRHMDMESSSLQRFSWFGPKLIPPWARKRPSMEISSFSYQKFAQFALEQVQRRTQLVPSPLQEQFNCMKSMDGKAELQMLSFQAPKIRHLRSLCIEGSDAMKVLDLAVFPEPEFDLPIFCANFFTASNMNIIVLDLNPLHDVIIQKEYREKYYNSLMPLGLKYTELLPWGGKITSESLRFFSPIVIWTKFTSSQQNHDVLYSAFVDYYMAWVELMDQATGDTDVSRIIRNRAAQHKYLTWRAEKDPGHRLLNRLIGESAAKDLVRNFLFNGVTTLGTKTFVDYFPEYRSEDGTVSEKRSIMGKSFETRPWDMGGAFIGMDL